MGKTYYYNLTKKQKNDFIFYLATNIQVMYDITYEGNNYTVVVFDLTKSEKNRISNYIVKCRLNWN